VNNNWINDYWELLVYCQKAVSRIGLFKMIFIRKAFLGPTGLFDFDETNLCSEK